MAPDVTRWAVGQARTVFADGRQRRQRRRAATRRRITYCAPWRSARARVTPGLVPLGAVDRERGVDGGRPRWRPTGRSHLPPPDPVDRRQQVEQLVGLQPGTPRAVG